MNLSKILFCIAILIGLHSVRAQTVIDSLRKVKESLPADSNKVLLSIDIAENLWRSNENDECIAEAGDALRLAKELKFNRGIGLAFIYQGIGHYRLSNFHQASTLFQLSTPFIEKSNAPKDLALGYHWNGNAYYRLSKYNEALESYLKALKIREGLHDEEGTAFSMYNIANIYFDQKDYEASLEYHLKSLSIKERLGDKRSIAFSYNNIANVYAAMNQDDKALSYYQKAYEIFTSLGNKQGIAYALGNLGKIYAKEKLFNTALGSLHQARSMFEQIGDKNALIEANNLIAEVLLQQQNYPSAEEHLSIAEKLAEETGVEDQLIQNYLLHARLDSARGNFVKAYEWQKKYTTKKESIFNAEKSKQITEMQSAFELERKDNEIAALNTEKALEESLRKNQQITFGAIIVSMILVSVALLFILRQRQKANKLLSDQKKYAEELNQLNDKLFSIISHDLRAPLWSLRGVLEMASKQMITEKELTSLLGSIGDNTQHVIDLLENLLNWSKGHLRGDKINRTDFELCNTVIDTIELHRPMANRKHIDIRHNINKKVLVHADRNMIELVLRNLISNALKFTPENGSVELTCQSSSNEVSLSIQDTGIGISKQNIDKLFSNQTFTTRGTANEKGTGLGLTLCREFIEKNGGTIRVESVEGKGSTFTITIPMASHKAQSSSISNQSMASTLTQSTSA